MGSDTKQTIQMSCQVFEITRSQTASDCYYTSDLFLPVHNHGNCPSRCTARVSGAWHVTGVEIDVVQVTVKRAIHVRLVKGRYHTPISAC